MSQMAAIPAMIVQSILRVRHATTPATSAATSRALDGPTASAPPRTKTAGATTAVKTEGTTNRNDRPSHAGKSILPKMAIMVNFEAKAMAVMPRMRTMICAALTKPPQSRLF